MTDMGKLPAEMLNVSRDVGAPRPTISMARGFRSRFGFQWWFLPLAALLLGLVGLSTSLFLEASVKRQKAVELQTLLGADITALEVWFQAQKAYASVVAGDPTVRELVGGVVARAVDRDGAHERLVGSPELQALREYLRPLARAQGYIDFVVSDPTGLVVAAVVDQAVGNPSLTRHVQFLAPALAGLVTVSRPFRAEIPLPDASGQLAWGRPTMFVAAPVRGETGDVIAALGLRIRPEVDFTRILHVARPGETGETYAFDANGLLVSQSRFDDQLRRIGLLPPDPAVRAIFTVELRDPGGDMAQGYTPELARVRQPLTRMAESATAGGSGTDVDGYRDYQGATVIGTWRWLDEYGFGVATEVQVSEAYASLRQLRLLFLALIGLLSLAAGGMIVATVLIARIGSSADAAVASAHRLGQYTLEHKIGSGGMGQVYRACHAMLRRPTAIKLLPQRLGGTALERFEQALQITSRLTHPNTVAIYDYGRTADGVLYYAMEYLHGSTLERLVQQAGPLPAGRVILLLRQVCGSLAEAHAAGLLHRNVTPRNMIVGERGGENDIVKLLDFGIADDHGGAQPDESGAVCPLPYVAPENMLDPDAVDQRSDLYSLAAVAYFMLTGTPPVIEKDGGNLATPSACLPAPVPDDLAALVMQCLARDQDARPADAMALDERLAKCSAAGTWTRRAASEWWANRPTLLEPRAG